MKRMKFLGTAFFMTVAMTSTARGQVEVHVRDNEKPIKGTLKQESSQGIVVGKEKISALDIVDVTYEVTPLSERLSTYRPAIKAERDAAEPGQEDQRKAHLKDAATKYETMLKKLAPGQESAARHLQFKIAFLAGLLAQENGGPADLAIERLKEFKSRYPNSWQIIRCLRLLADLLMSQKRFDEAEQTYKELTGLNVPDEVKHEAELSAAMVSLRAGQHDRALKKLNELAARLPKNSRFATRARIAEAECLVAAKKLDEARKSLKTIIDDAKDKDVKAAAYNALGLSYFKAGQLKEARWEFLWVDVVYNQDRAEHARALYYLMLTFEQLGEAQRALQCRELLANNRRFNGLEYQRWAREKKK
jgi:TolA-binding protein